MELRSMKKGRHCKHEDSVQQFLHVSPLKFFPQILFPTFFFVSFSWYYNHKIDGWDQVHTTFTSSNAYIINYSWKIGRELNLVVWWSAFMITKLKSAKSSYLHILYIIMAILYWTTKFESANILTKAIWDPSAKFNSSQYFWLCNSYTTVTRIYRGKTPDPEGEVWFSAINPRWPWYKCYISCSWLVHRILSIETISKAPSNKEEPSRASLSPVLCHTAWLDQPTFRS